MLLHGKEINVINFQVCYLIMYHLLLESYFGNYKACKYRLQEKSERPTEHPLSVACKMVLSYLSIRIKSLSVPNETTY